MILRHEIGAKYPDGHEEKEIIELVVYGESRSFSAMSRTTGLTVGIAAKLMLTSRMFSY